jgi:uncharacterized protein (DUF58 family)
VSARWPTGDDKGLLAAAEEAAHVMRLPFRSQLWRGAVGQWQGAGRGSSLEFEDHRAYVPGDDPRHINWPAYARTGHYSLKVYREEVSPSVDVVLDVSSSMVVAEDKARRALELLLFVLMGGRGAGASVRAGAAAGASVTPLEWSPPAVPVLPVAAAAGPPDLSRVVLRAGTLRVFITDTLFAASPDPLLGRLSSAGGRAIVLAPWGQEETDPDWSGPTELVDCETETLRDEHVDAEALVRYREAYQRHLALWREAAQRQGSAFARVGPTGTLLQALRDEALPYGAVEARG